MDTHAALFHISLKLEATAITNHRYKLWHVRVVKIDLGFLKRPSTRMLKDELSSLDTRTCTDSILCYWHEGAARLRLL